ncbi:MAG TPA: DUF423 domain-containing protein [Roseomonas sp.]|jgi:uncharacterized membrane protein YgdD (TMEM256/DUF423 family)
MHRLWIALGALAGLGAVGLSAWAAHGAPSVLQPAALESLRSGITMQGWHALALLATGLFAERRGGLLAHLAGAAFAIGMVLFCAGVYSGALAGVHLGPVAPVGGVTLMLGWAMLFLAALKRA